MKKSRPLVAFNPQYARLVRMVAGSILRQHPLAVGRHDRMQKRADPLLGVLDQHDVTAATAEMVPALESCTT